MIVKVVAEELDVRDGPSSDIGVGEVAREKDKGHIADVIRVSKTRDLSDLERGIPICEEHLGRVLYLWQPARVHKFLGDPLALWRVAQG